MTGKRERILSSAEEEFLEHGYNGTTIDAIVERSGGSKSTVYAHFPDKGVLFADALARVRDGIDFSLSRFRAQHPGDTREALVLLGVELLTALYHQRSLHLLRLVVSEAHRFPDVARRYLEEGPEESIRQIGRFLAERRADGETNLPEPDRGARILFSLFRGAGDMRVLLGVDAPPSPDAIVAAAEEAVEVFLRLSDSTAQPEP